MSKISNSSGMVAVHQTLSIQYGQYDDWPRRRLAAASSSLSKNKERKYLLEQVVFDLSIQSSRVLTRIFLGRHGVSIECDDVSRSRVWPNVEVGNETILAAAVAYKALAEIVLDEKCQPHGVFSILPFRLCDFARFNSDLLAEHLF